MNNAQPPELDLLARREPRGAQTHGEGYARVVRGLKILLGLFVAGVVAVIFLWPELEQTAPKVLPDDAPEVARNVLLKPRFEAVDKDVQPYTITADRAVQNNNDPDLIDLTKPVADITMKDGTWVMVEADSGTYRQEAQLMELSGHVRVFQDQGYEMRGDKVQVNMKTQRVVSTSDVAGQGPLGQLSAAGMDADGEAGVLVFHGPATLVLNQSVLE